MEGLLMDGLLLHGHNLRGSATMVRVQSNQ